MDSQKRLNLCLALAVVLTLLIVVVLVARKERGDKKKAASHEPMSVIRHQTSDDAGLQEMPTDLNGA